MRELVRQDIKLRFEYSNFVTDFPRSKFRFDATQPIELITVLNPQIMSELLNDLDKDKFVLAQGTLAPDLIESGSKLSSSMADTIKTHHNDSPLAREFRSAVRSFTCRLFS